jgi:hypothetical protein
MEKKRIIHVQRVILLSQVLLDTAHISLESAFIPLGQNTRTN